MTVHYPRFWALSVRSTKPVSTDSRRDQRFGKRPAAGPALQLNQTRIALYHRKNLRYSKEGLPLILDHSNLVSHPTTPAWASEVCRPDPHTTEFWHHVSTVFSSDYRETVTVAVVQNGIDAPRQILICGHRFTPDEAMELVEAAEIAIGLVPRSTRFGGTR